MSPVKATNEALENAKKAVDAKNAAIGPLANTAEVKAEDGTITAAAVVAVKGLRHRAGSTRGKNPSIITWKAFDQESPDTLPKTMAEFAEMTSVTEEDKLVSYLIEGFNSEAYGLASDELYEYVDDSWPAEKQAQFRLMVRNFAKLQKLSIADAVEKIKPLLG